MVKGDAAQLRDALLNIATNGLEAMEDGGRLGVATHRADGGVVIEIADTGRGIPREYRKSVFDPFFTTKGAGKGTGLGLYITQEIVEKHNGEVKVENMPGEGAKFTVSLPGERDAEDTGSGG